MKISGIYKIESKIKPERIYIGSAVNIGKRWIMHLSHLRRNIHYSKKLQRHFNKYGEADLQFIILLGCNKEDLLNIEQYFLDSYKPYFNNCQFAYSRLGQKASDETRGKISEFNKGKHSFKHSEEWNRNNAESRKGKFIAWNKGIKGNHLSEETKKKMSKSRMGRIVSEETRMKISKANKGYKNTPKQREAQSKRQLGKKRGSRNKLRIA
jgi:group I intron endonuclease